MSGSPDLPSLRSFSAPDGHRPVGDVMLGAGRSGVVFRTKLPSGVEVARKVFDSEGLAEAVQIVFLGSVNPYAWNEDAVACAVLRRRIMTGLVRYWFGDRVRVANALGSGWNTTWRAFEIYTELVKGRPPALRQPLRSPSNEHGRTEADELLHEVMHPLQDRLEEAGFDGLVWQAGRGNPVALANFLLEEHAGERRWAWIDLESGVPALFPLQPLDLFRFYLPRSWRLGRPLFDDVDGERLIGYLQTEREGLVRALGEDAFEALVTDAEALAQHQDRWKSMSRLERGIMSQLVRGKIDAEQAVAYRKNPLRYYAREAVRLPRGAFMAGLGAVDRAFARVRRLPYGRLPKAAFGFFTSTEYRVWLARYFVGERISSWAHRGQLLPAEVQKLRTQLAREESSTYLADFGVHLGLKPVVKAVEYFVFPGLYAAGVINEGTLAIALIFGGPIARSMYSAARCLQSILTRREAPWVALGFGLIPVIGNLAFPVQIIYSSTDEEDVVAQFLLYDGCSLVGRKLPIWGGRDTLTEHVLNRLPDYIVKLRPAHSSHE